MPHCAGFVRSQFANGWIPCTRAAIAGDILCSSHRDAIDSALLGMMEMALAKRLIGLEELVVPDEESRTKQYREIAQLVSEMPAVHRRDVTAAVGPTAAARCWRRRGRGSDIAERQPDEFADNHALELKICTQRFSSDAGQVAKIEAPLGYANIRAHALFHRDFLRKQQAGAVSNSNAPQMNTGKRR